MFYVQCLYPVCHCVQCRSAPISSSWQFGNVLTDCPLYLFQFWGKNWIKLIFFAIFGVGWMSIETTRFFTNCDLIPTQRGRCRVTQHKDTSVVMLGVTVTVYCYAECRCADCYWVKGAALKR
jgi:hypothetical protein